MVRIVRDLCLLAAVIIAGYQMIQWPDGVVTIACITALGMLGIWIVGGR